MAVTARDEREREREGESLDDVSLMEKGRDQRWKRKTKAILDYPYAAHLPSLLLFFSAT